MSKKPNLTLHRSPQFSEAAGRLSELALELSNLEKQRQEVHAGLASHGTARQDAINEEAQAMLTGGAPVAAAMQHRERLIKTLGELDHRIAVLREAERLQRNIVGKLAGEVSREICAELLPQHRANVAAVAHAALALADACAAERNLRDELAGQGIQFAGHLRAMPLRGFELDGTSTLSRYLLEAVAYEFLAAKELPAVLRSHIASPAKPQARQTVAAILPGDWNSPD